MKLTKEQEKGQEVLSTLIKRSWEDESFKRELINNPKVAIANLNLEGIQVSEKSTIVVEDQMDNSIIFLNIPVKPDIDKMELTDEQLEMVSGGEFFGSVAIGITIGAALGLIYNKL